MALKNDETISKLGKRLFELMEEQNIQTPKELAKMLYDTDLVHVKTRDNCNSENTDRQNAIGSIEKKIIRHIKTGTISDSSGEYLPGYCYIFGCSSDFILGLTPIRSDDYDIRRMCEMTGLDEKVIGKFIDYNNEDNSHIAQWWSYILNQSLFEDIPDDLEYAADDLEEQYRVAGILEALKWQIDHCPKDHNKDTIRLYGDQAEYEERYNTKVSSFQGLLYKISRLFTDAIEKQLIESKEQFKKNEREDDLNHVKKLARQGVHYFNFRKLNPK